MNCTIALILIVLILLLYKSKDVFTNDTQFPDVYVMNLKRHENRRESIEKQLKKLNIKYNIIEAFDGHDSANKSELTEWPCLSNDPKYNGIKGLNITYLKVLQTAIKSKNKWFIVFEDDSVLPSNFKEVVLKTIKEKPDVEVINFDARNTDCPNGFFSADLCCVMYKNNKKNIEILIHEIDPDLSYYMYDYTERGVHPERADCVFDLYLANLLHRYDFNVMCVPIVKSDGFKSQILHYEKNQKNLRESMTNNRLIDFPDTFYINLKRHKKRRAFMDKQLKELDIPYTRIEAIDAKTYPDQQFLLDWVCMKGDVKMGSKGIQLSNMKVFEAALKNINNNNSDFILMLEDDAILNPDFKIVVEDIVYNYPDINFVNFDDRYAINRWGMSGVMIAKSLLPFLLKEFNWKTSDYMKIYNDSVENRPSNPYPAQCHHDLFVNNLMAVNGIDILSVPIINSDTFESSIQEKCTTLGGCKEPS